MIYEAQLIGFKEGIKLGLVWFVLYAYLRVSDRTSLMKPFYMGIAVALVTSFASFFITTGFFAREFLSNIISMSFALFLLLSAATLFHMTGTDLLKPFQRGPSGTHGADQNGAFSFDNSWIPWIIVFLSALLFAAPDLTGFMFFLRELSFMRESELITYASALVGLCIAAAIVVAVVKLIKPYWVGNIFDIPQFFLFLAIIKLFGSGVKGISELSLLPSVQRGFMKFIHDFVHQTFVFLMVPDHPLLKTTVWDFIAFFFGPNFASYASLFILLSLPLLFIHQSLLKPVPEPDAPSAAERRKIKSTILTDRRKKTIPVVFFILLILVSWFYQTGETVSKLFVPKPKPVVVDKGIIVIPLKDPTMDLMDGSLHTFSLLHEGEEIRILIIKKSDNSLSVCLDACEICPPEGYGRREDHLVCIYCGTPIHIDSLGQPGGCNPIPLVVHIDENFVRIELKEIVKKWGFILAGSTKEEVPERTGDDKKHEGHD